MPFSPTYEDIDEALAPVSEFVRSLTELEAEFSNAQFSMYIDNMRLNIPIEMDVMVGEDGRVVLGTAPPTQSIETTFMPVFHQMRLTITRESDSDEHK